jgi:hypothetical protein
MLKIKVEKILVISFIGFIIPFFVILGGNPSLKAGLPASDPKTEVNFEKRLQSLEDNLVTGSITKQEYDSLSDLLRLQIKGNDALADEGHKLDKIPDWVVKLGISEPEGMKFDQDFSNYTSVDSPSEGFNSVSLVYNGDYDMAVKAAAKIAASAKLVPGGNFIAKNSPVSNVTHNTSKVVTYLNYSLGNTDQDFLISLQVEPSGKLFIEVTDNKQLNKCLMAYEPLNNRQNSNLKRKKQ